MKEYKEETMQRSSTRNHWSCVGVGWILGLPEGVVLDATKVE